MNDTGNAKGRMDRRRFIETAVGSALAGGLALRFGSAVGAPEKNRVTVQVYPGSMLNLPLYAGVDEKIFAKHGLDVVITAVPAGPLAQQALVSGDLDIAYGSSDPGIGAKAKGADTQIFLGFFNANIWALLARNGVNAPNSGKGYPAVMRDLKGLRFGVTGRGAASEFIVRAMFEEAGMSGDDATYIAVGGPATSYPAMMTGNVDVVLAFEPMITLVETQKTGSLLVDFRKGEGPASLQRMNGAFVTFNALRSFLRKNPETIKAFQAGWIESVKWSQNPANRAAVGALTKKYVSIGNVPNLDQVVDKLINDNFKYFAWTVDPKGIAAYSDFLLKSKLISSPVDPSDYVAAIAPRP